MKLYKVTHSKVGSSQVRVDYVNAKDYDSAAFKISTLYPHERDIRMVVEIPK